MAILGAIMGVTRGSHWGAIMGAIRGSHKGGPDFVYTHVLLDYHSQLYSFLKGAAGTLLTKPDW